MKSTTAWGMGVLVVGVTTFATLAWVNEKDVGAEPWWQQAPSQHRSPSPGLLRALSLTYPTGDFQPAWVAQSAVAERKMPVGRPLGIGHAKSVVSPLALDPVSFTPLGPRPLGSGNTANAGRVNDIVVDPTNDTIAYFASDGGGVWKTTNCCSSATTWQVKTDFPEIASMAIGDLTIDPSNANVIYAGTGDLRFGSFSFGAAGLLRSADKGETWTLLGTDVFNPLYAPSIGGYPQYQAIGQVAVDPNNSANLIVGTKTGLYFSYDTGANWTGPCYTNSFSTQRQDITGLLAIDQGSTTKLIAAVGTRGLPTPVQPDLVNNGANGVYTVNLPASGCPVAWTTSSRADNGFVASGFVDAIADGVPDTTFGRIELAVAPSDANVIYALVANSAARNVLGVWRSQDAGNTWTQRATAATVSAVSPGGTTCANAASGGSQMWYDAGLTVHPTNADIVYMSAVDLFRSSDGGANFNDLTCGYSTGNVHVDHHARAFVASDPSRLLLGSDGGMWYSSNATATTPSFIPLNSSVNTIEFYSGDITANFATSATPGINGGAQDNGCSWATWSGNPGPTSWTKQTFCGDGIFTRIEPVLAQRWYYSSQNGVVRATSAGPGGATSSIVPTTGGSWGGDRLSFVMPFEIYRYGATDASGSGCTAASGCTRMIAGTYRVWETLAGGFPSSSWYINSPDLTKNNLIVGSDNRSFINQLTHAVSTPSMGMVGTNDGNVWMGFNLGAGTANSATWVNLTQGNAVLPNRPIMDVTHDPVNALVGYAAVGGFDQNTAATPGHVFQVTCAAQCASFTWANKTGNLPNIPVNTILANPNIPRQVFVGTDWGLYYTDDITVASPVWSRHEGLPHVMVWDMSIDRGFTTLAVFTRSRGAWAWPLPTIPLPEDMFKDGFESP